MLNPYPDGLRYALDVQRVIAARLIRLSQADAAAAVEANLMIAEKFVAFAEALAAAGAALVSGASMLTVLACAQQPIHRRVWANRRRLCR
jgi:hypothetical protein